MIIDYQPRGVCSRRMTLEVEEGVIRDGAFVGTDVLCPRLPRI